MPATPSASTSTSPISEISELQTSSVLPYSRNLSTISSVTLYANTSSHSTPYEPLLPPISQSVCDVISQQPRHSQIISFPRWSQNDLKQQDEKTRHSDSSNPNPSKRLRWIKVGLETVIVVWSLYTMARYLYAFTIYDSLNGQLASLGLAICAGLSFAFTCCSVILSAVNRHLLVRGVYVKSLSHVHSILRYPPSFFFLFPAITNFILLLVWRKTSTTDLNFHHRCKTDVDLLWTIADSPCGNIGRPWGVWITLAILRIALSLSVIIALHNIQSLQVIPMPKLSYSKIPKSERTKHTVSSKKLASIPPLTHEERAIHHQVTEGSLSNKSSWRHRLRSAKSHSSGASADAASYGNTDFLPIPIASESTFMERFRRLISLITQETDDAVAYARASVGSTSCNSQESAESPTLNGSCQGLDKEPHTPEYNHIPTYDDQEDDFYGSPPPEGHSDNNYPLPYPAEEQIPMMNGYIKRMPTIESMGSRELVGSIGTGNTNHERNGPRPSTRNTMLSWNETEMSGSDSRRKSLTAQAELLYGMNSASEVGELVKQGLSSGSSDAEGENQEPLLDYNSSTTGSKNSAQSFHTTHSEVEATDSLKFSIVKDEKVS